MHAANEFRAIMADGCRGVLSDLCPGSRSAQSSTGPFVRRPEGDDGERRTRQVDAEGRRQLARQVHCLVNADFLPQFCILWQVARHPRHEPHLEPVSLMKRRQIEPGVHHEAEIPAIIAHSCREVLSELCRDSPAGGHAE
jgi:hypothetical protein